MLKNLQYYNEYNDDWSNVSARNNRAVSAYLKQLATNLTVKKSFDTLPNVNANRLRDHTFRWAKSKGLSDDLATEMAQKLDIKTAAEFRQHISTAVNRLVQSLKRSEGGSSRGWWWQGPREPAPPQKFAIISELYYLNAPLEIPRSAPRVMTMKSSAWLLSAVTERLLAHGLTPAAHIAFQGGFALSTQAMKDALASGVRTFIHIDDAIYSGSQKSTLVEGIGRVLASAKQHKYKVRVIIGAAYSTAKGERRIRHAANNAGVSLVLVAPGQLREPKFSPKLLRALANAGVPYRGPTFTILPFKVPDYASFSPENLSKYLENATNKPVYKTMPKRPFLNRLNALKPKRVVSHPLPILLPPQKPKKKKRFFAGGKIFS
jgi:hypothetical protein